MSLAIDSMLGDLSKHVKKIILKWNEVDIEGRLFYLCNEDFTKYNNEMDEMNNHVSKSLTLDLIDDGVEIMNEDECEKVMDH